MLPMTIRPRLGRFLLAALVAATMLTGLAGCGKKEIEALKSRGTTIEQELADTKAKLAETTQELEDARTAAQKSDTKEEALVDQLNKVRIERDKLKQELVALKKRR
jgi:chromosome segregation ATPase